MELNIKNDGKMKHQSWECNHAEIDCETGYGHNKEEAIKNYLHSIREYNDKVNDIYLKTLLMASPFKCKHLDLKQEYNPMQNIFGQYCKDCGELIPIKG